MTPLQIYLWQQADTIRQTASSLSHFISTGWFMVITLSIIFITCPDEGMAAMAKRTFKRFMLLSPIPVAFAIAGAMMPSSKTIALMVALPAIANSEPIQKDLPELYKLAVDALKQQITWKNNQ